MYFSDTPMLINPGNPVPVERNRKGSGYGAEWSHFLRNARTDLIFGDIHVVTRLKVEPESRALTEVAAESQRQLSRHRSMSINYMADAHWRHTNIACETTARFPTLRVIP